MLAQCHKVHKVSPQLVSAGAFLGGGKVEGGGMGQGQGGGRVVIQVGWPAEV